MGAAMYNSSRIRCRQGAVSSSGSTILKVGEKVKPSISNGRGSRGGQRIAGISVDGRAPVLAASGNKGIPLSGADGLELATGETKTQTSIAKITMNPERGIETARQVSSEPARQPPRHESKAWIPECHVQQRGAGRQTRPERSRDRNRGGAAELTQCRIPILLLCGSVDGPDPFG